MINRLIVFRYHDHFKICKENVLFIKRLNPEAKILGLYGGNPDKKSPITDLFDYNYSLPFEDAYYKWMHGDLCLRNWFKNHGKNIDFDVINLLEWDMILLDSVDKIYKHIKKHDIGITDLFSYKRAKEINWHWIFVQDWQWKQQIKEIENIFGKVNIQNFNFGIFGAIQIPRSFLKEYINYSPSSYANDEARLCAYAQAMGINVCDNKLKNSKNIFIADEYESLKKQNIIDKVKNGATAIHPIRDIDIIKQVILNKKN